ncbi:hypothetical protein KDA_76680 [Dictyobacter alpinus]|uniref:Uncharacterized protein n=1 Tax=Dictyobacter alpinus TaxID=2014873 RepID=A0A402BLG5_9CHLR|nr:hypothetical protein KDA_76680 [Dictyobacter alpinus]
MTAQHISRYVQPYQDGIQCFQRRYGRVSLQNRFKVVRFDHTHLICQTIDLLSIKLTPIAKDYRRKGSI